MSTINYFLIGIISLVVVISVIFFVVNSKSKSNEASLNYRNITSDEARIELEKDSSIILLDVRSKEEFEEKHIKGAILIPLGELEDRVTTEIPDKESRIFVYCRSGVRSISASETLVNLGYKNVYNLGGILDWKYETE